MELGSVYEEVILDHKRRPRNYREMPDADRRIEGYNPLCGDHLSFFVKLDGDRIEDVSFEGEGCAISMASASMMTEAVRGRPIDEALALYDEIHRLLTDEDVDPDEAELGRLMALAGVRAYPARVKCASLGWQALRTALKAANERQVSTE